MLYLEDDFSESLPQKPNISPCSNHPYKRRIHSISEDYSKLDVSNKVEQLLFEVQQFRRNEPFQLKPNPLKTNNKCVFESSKAVNVSRIGHQIIKEQLYNSPLMKEKIEPSEFINQVRETFKQSKLLSNYDETELELIESLKRLDQIDELNNQNKRRSSNLLSIYDLRK